MTAITCKEREYLRELAKKQMEYAHLPEMEEKKKMWFDLNTGKEAVPPVVVESWTFDPDMMPDSVFQCISPKAREVEYKLLKNIREYELIHDDKVIPDFYPMRYQVDVDEFGIKVEEKHAVDANGRNVGYEYVAPIQDLEEDFYMLKPSEIHVKWDETEKEKNFVQEILGDIMPVELIGTPPDIALSLHMSRLLGLEGMMMALYDCPEMVHKLMEYLANNQLRVMKAYEENGILTVNNGNHESCLSSFCFTDEIPKEPFDKPRVKDIWLWTENEETASVSPDMFREFFLPYTAKVANEIGLVYYGCCEPLHFVLEDVLKAIPNTRKVSVSPWSDQEQIGEILRGTKVVFSRKPLANYLSIDKTFHEDAWAAHINETLHAARGCQCEILMRDIYQVAELANVKRAVEIAKSLAKNRP